MIQIKPKEVGLPLRTATQLRVTSDKMQSNATTCILHFEFFDIENSLIYSGNLTMTEEEFEAWGADNTYIEDLVITRLELERE